MYIAWKQAAKTLGKSVSAFCQRSFIFPAVTKKRKKSCFCPSQEVLYKHFTAWCGAPQFCCRRLLSWKRELRVMHYFVGILTK